MDSKKSNVRIYMSHLIKNLSRITWITFKRFWDSASPRDTLEALGLLVVAAPLISEAKSPVEMSSFKRVVSVHHLVERENRFCSLLLLLLLNGIQIML